MTIDRNLIRRLATLQTCLEMLGYQHHSVAHLIELIRYENPEVSISLHRDALNTARAMENEVLGAITQELNRVLVARIDVESDSSPSTPGPGTVRIQAIEKRLDDVDHQANCTSAHAIRHEARIDQIERQVAAQSVEYSAREMRLIDERDAALSRAERCEQRLDNRIDSALQVIGDQIADLDKRFAIMEASHAHERMNDLERMVAGHERRLPALGDALSTGIIETNAATRALAARVDGMERVVDKFHQRCSDVSVIDDRVAGITKRLESYERANAAGHGDLAAGTQALTGRVSALAARLTGRLDDLEHRLRGG